MRRPLFQAYLLLSTLLLVGCAQASSASLTPTASPPVCQGHAGGAPLAQPAAPASVYSGSDDGTVWALDAASGAVRWHVQLVGAYHSTVAALEAGVVYVQAYEIGGPRTFFDAFRASDGALLWHQTLASEGAVAAVSQGGIYLTFGEYSNISATPSAIEARRTQDGSLLWHTQLEGTGPPQALLDQGTLYVTSFSTLLPGPGWYYATTSLEALNANSGIVCWTSQVSRTNSIAAVATRQVYLLDTGTDVVCDPRILHVLDRRNGAEQWHLEGSFLDLPGVEQDLAFVQAVPKGCAASYPYEQGMLSALRTRDGTSAWQITIPFGEGSLANEGVLYVPAGDGDLAAYRASTGVRLWRAQKESGWLSLFDGVLYTSFEGGLDALDPATGTVEWRYQTPDGMGLSAVAHGRLYGKVSRITSSGGEDDAIVALSAGTGQLLWRVEIGTTLGAPLVG